MVLPFQLPTLWFIKSSLIFRTHGCAHSCQSGFYYFSIRQYAYSIDPVWIDAEGEGNLKATTVFLHSSAKTQKRDDKSTYQ